MRSKKVLTLVLVLPLGIAVEGMTLRAAAPPEAPDVVSPTTQPVPPSLEGIRIGMTVAQVAAMPDIDVGGSRKVVVKGSLHISSYLDLPKCYEGFSLRSIKTPQRGGWLVANNDEKVVWLRMFYLKRSGAIERVTEADPTPASMFALLSERWGAPTDSSISQGELHNGFNAVVARERLEKVTWQVGGIRAIYAFGVAVVDPAKHPLLAQAPGDVLSQFRADVTIYDSAAVDAAEKAAADAESRDAKGKVKF